MNQPQNTTNNRTCKTCLKTIQRSIYQDYHKNCAKNTGINPPLKNTTHTPPITNTDHPTNGEIYQLTGTPTEKTISNGNTWEESKVQPKNNKDFIPTTNGYIPRKIGKKNDTQILHIAHQQKINTLLIGETGTGKTHAIRNFCYENKLPYMRVNLNEATTVEDLVGQWIPDKNGGFKWEDGVLTRFMRNGGVFVCDEINAANSGVLFILHSVLDDEKKIVLVQKDGELVHSHQNFWFVSTMNPDYEGTKPLNSALKDRFGLILNYDYDNKVEKQLIKNEKLLTLAGKLRDMYKKGEVLTPVSTRSLIQFCNNTGYFGEDLAIELFLNKFSNEESIAIRSVIELVLKDRKDNPLLNQTEQEDDKNE